MNAHDEMCACIHAYGYSDPRTQAAIAAYTAAGHGSRA